MQTGKFIRLAFDDENPKIPKTLARKNVASLTLIQIFKFIAQPYDLSIVEAVQSIVIQRCKKCGCTQFDCSNCVEKTGDACHWVAEDLCSACVPGKKGKRSVSPKVAIKKVRKTTPARLKHKASASRE